MLRASFALLDAVGAAWATVEDAIATLVELENNRKAREAHRKKLRLLRAVRPLVRSAIMHCVSRLANLAGQAAEPKASVNPRAFVAASTALRAVASGTSAPLSLLPCLLLKTPAVLWEDAAVGTVHA